MSSEGAQGCGDKVSVLSSSLHQRMQSVEATGLEKQGGQVYVGNFPKNVTVHSSVSEEFAKFIRKQLISSLVTQWEYRVLGEEEQRPLAGQPAAVRWSEAAGCPLACENSSRRLPTGRRLGGLVQVAGCLGPPRGCLPVV